MSLVRCAPVGSADGIVPSFFRHGERGHSLGTNLRSGGNWLRARQISDDSRERKLRQRHRGFDQPQAVTIKSSGRRTLSVSTSII